MRDPKNGLKNMLGTPLTWPKTEKIDLNKVFQCFDWQENKKGNLCK